jgi:hypothetical protein
VAPQCPVQWVAGTLLLEVKWPRHEADYSLPCSAEVKNVRSYISNTICIVMSWCLTKHSASFTFLTLHGKF